MEKPEVMEDLAFIGINGRETPTYFKYSKFDTYLQILIALTFKMV